MAERRFDDQMEVVTEWTLQIAIYFEQPSFTHALIWSSRSAQLVAVIPQPKIFVFSMFRFTFDDPQLSNAIACSPRPPNK